jgi:NitT/TauT family transport system ATP-binding protein
METLELVGLSDSVDKYPWQLSGGMKMRVSIARALSVAPRILLLDEPFGALDEMTRDQLNEDLLAIRERDRFTAFFVTHSVAEAVFLSTRIVVLSSNPGRIAQVIDVPFAYPRCAELRESPEFLQLLAATSHSLRSVLAP